MNMRERSRRMGHPASENAPRGGVGGDVTGQMWQEVKEHASDVKTGHHWWSECSPPGRLPSTAGGEETGGRGGYPLGKFSCEEETGRDLEGVNGLMKGPLYGAYNTFI